jgi:hypothetical protein
MCILVLPITFRKAGSCNFVVVYALKNMVDAMLAEIFMLRLEAIAQLSRYPVQATDRFVPLNPAVRTEFKNGSGDHPRLKLTSALPPKADISRKLGHVR